MQACSKDLQACGKACELAMGNRKQTARKLERMIRLLLQACSKDLQACDKDLQACSKGRKLAARLVSLRQGIASSRQANRKETGKND